MCKDIKVIDFHCHPSLKTLLGNDVENQRNNCWKNVNVRGFYGVVDKLVGRIFDSQASLKQIKKGNIKIAIAAIFPVEIPFLTGTIYNLPGLTLLNASDKISVLSHSLFEKIVNKTIGYNQLGKEELVHLMRSENKESGFKLLQSINEYDENKLNIILTLEGGHALYDDEDNATETEIINNLNEIKNGPYRILYFTPAHIAQNLICTHAWGMKMIEHEKFRPLGKGFTTTGIKVLEAAIDSSTGKRILTDIKHMSLYSRIKYHEFLNTGSYTNIPVIMSHGGVTGCSYHNMPIYKYRYINNNKQVEVKYSLHKGLMKTLFNTWSINLYDEEIAVIINSDGIIGLNLDERILGTKQKKAENVIEYFSAEEFNEFKLSIDSNLPYFQAVPDMNFIQRLSASLSYGNDLKHICNNILHIVKIGGQNAWKHICIGSDFDGLINAVECCKNAKKYKKLSKKLERMLPKMARKNPATDYFITDIKKQVKGIMYENALSFLQKYYT